MAPQVDSQACFLQTWHVLGVPGESRDFGNSIKALGRGKARKCSITCIIREAVSSTSRVIDRYATL